MNATFNFTFTTREEYLAQKKEWFGHYKLARQAVRQAKEDIKEADRQGQSVYPAMRQKREAVEALDKLVKLRQDSRSEAYRQYQERVSTSV